MTASNAVLSSWKEIAAYLGKGVRTVQRWEREIGLPVRRPVEHNQRIVIAVPAELDAWVLRQVPKAAALGRGRAQLRLQETRALRAKLREATCRVTNTTRLLIDTAQHRSNMGKPSECHR